MRHSLISIPYAILATSIAPAVKAAFYQVSDTFIGNSFYSGFNAQAIQDPTHGRVK